MSEIYLYHTIEEIPTIKRPVVTVGTFDGVHLGHRKILEEMRRLAGEVGGETLLVTFYPHPRIALKKDADKLRLLNTPEEKAELLAKSGIDHLLILNFTQEFSQLSEREFIGNLLVDKLHLHTLVVGYNHRFGHDRLGDYSTLKTLSRELGFRVLEIDRQQISDLSVSSTNIREALITGRLHEANHMLGYAYQITATVVDGSKTGRILGFPTANLELVSPYKLLPAGGVYAVEALLDGKQYGGMCNIGTRPTFGQKNLQAEVNLFNFEGGIYGKTMKVAFIERLRDEMKFENPEALITRLHLDKDQAMRILQQNKYSF